MKACGLRVLKRFTETSLNLMSSRKILIKNIAAPLTLLALGFVIIIRASTTSYSPDSWSYVDISRGLLDGSRVLGSINGEHDFQNQPWFNDSFPFLWPFILLPGITLFGATAPVGVYVFVFIWLATVFILHLWWVKFGYSQLISWTPGLFLFGLPGYAEEALGGRSIPMSILILSILIYITFHGEDLPLSRRKLLWMGVLLGSIAMNRFDGVILGPLIIAILLIARKISLRKTPYILIPWVLMIWLWVMYSWRTSRVLFANNNNATIMRDRNSQITEWFGSRETPDYSIVGFFQKISNNLKPLLSSLNDSSQISNYRSAISLTIAALVIVTSLKLVRGQMSRESIVKGEMSEVRVKHLQIMITILAIMILIEFVQMIATGYTDLRYWCIPTSTLLFVIPLLFPMLRNSKASNTLKAVTILALIVGTSLALQPVTKNLYFRYDQSSKDTYWISCIKRTSAPAIVTGMEAFRIPATTNLKVLYRPENFKELTKGDWEDITIRFGIESWVDATAGRESMPPNAVGVISSTNCGSK